METDFSKRVQQLINRLKNCFWDVHNLNLTVHPDFGVLNLSNVLKSLYSTLSDV